MSLMWADGFENASLWGKAYTLNPSNLPTLGTGRNGGGIDMSPSANPGEFIWDFPAADQHATITFGVAMWFGSTSSGGFPNSTSTPFFTLYGDGQSTLHTQGYFAGGAGGNLTVTRGTSTLGTTSGLSFTTDTWYYLEVQATLNDSTGAITVKGNGTTILSLTGQDTKNGGTGSVYTAIGFRARSSIAVGHAVVDDLYVLNGAGSVYNSFLGDVTVETLRPDGNGNYSQWTGSDGNSTDNYLLVDEATYDVADYVSSSTTNNKDTYTYGALTASSGAVKGVVAKAVAAKSASGSQDYRQITRISSTDYNGATTALDTSDLPRRQVWEQSPATASDWTISEVNGAEFGVEVL